MDEQNNDAVELAASLTAAWLANPNSRVNPDDVPAFLQSMYASVTGLSDGGASATVEEAPQEYTPAVTVRKSLASKDHIISLIDGKPYRTLRRHLTSNGLTPDEYRARYGLKADYPMVASSYSDSRREMAHRIGLGRKAGEKVVKKTDDAAPADKPVRKSRKSATDAAKAHLEG
ncbi:MucR family transcriptional regulator [Sphingomonas sp. CFBP 8760]|uniref:MucR family transcriptional regulator n=1 Tax=Sphingomonas sp. CFBP 8760 TaxID=2775282 RepID=UPI0018FEED7E|nr:MucR family transcriptional regulator [Sphingomonas sp. CFBP 8760]